MEGHKLSINQTKETENTPENKEISKAPEGWKTHNSVAQELGIHSDKLKSIVKLYDKNDPQYFDNLKDKIGHSRVHYSPKLIEIIAEKIKKSKEVKIAPDDARTNKALANELVINPGVVAKIASDYRKSNPEYFENFKKIGGQEVEHYTGEFVKILIPKIIEFKETPEAPKNWRTKSVLAVELGDIDPLRIVKIADRYKDTHKEYFKNFKINDGRIFEHYSPELVAIITDEIGVLEGKREKKKLENVSKNDLENQENVLKTEFENLAQEISNEQNEEAIKIGEILRLLPGSAHDIILKYHPEYKGLKTEYIKEVIAEYLGDFLLNQNEWQPRDIAKYKEVMDIEGIQEEILINLKNGCLVFINNERKNNPNIDEASLVDAYFQKEEMLALSASTIPEIQNAIQELRQYYENIFTLREKKPNNIVETMRAGRTFPDINQLVNIQEISNNQKMLIADEMGLGKSASSILAKEYLQAKCALVIVPSNVQDTWKNYLSDMVGKNGKQIGYFKNGLSPKTLTVESSKDLEQLKSEAFDYILISLEKISKESYTDALKQTDFDMMIVDEVHKFKNIESGVRSKALTDLSEKIQGDNQYLALLSGTPIPNKVKDIGITLKLLYPERYKEFNNKEMVKRILYGDLIDLRSELLKRMQMKEIATSIEMPMLTKIDVPVELTLEEREVYEILLEEDELTALDKIIVFRQFLLNPEILKVEPGFEGAKVKKLAQTLNSDLKTQEKIVVFVNSYIEGVIKGKQNIISKMNLPKDVIVEEIHGEITHEERKRIEDELKSGNKKTVVFVSGQTADVGVDFSGADGVIFYNEPWSNYEKAQQQSRVYREGLQNPLVSKTIMTRNSIEEGMRDYSNSKERAIKKLLKGISNTDAEKKLLYGDSNLENNDIEADTQLSKEYMSDREKLMIHFGQGFQSGEEIFRKEMSIKGKEYAELYQKLGRLTYQGNNARVTATLLENMINERQEIPKDLRIIDIASGPEMLKNASSEKIKDSIISTDINIEHFSNSAQPEKTVSASYLNLPALDESADYVNLGFALHQTSPINFYKKNYERLQVLAEMNRVLKPGGRAIVSMLHNIEFSNEESFNELVGKIGFRLVPEYNGAVKGGENYKANFITLEKVNKIEEYKNDALKFASADNQRYILNLGNKIGREALKGLDIKRKPRGENRLRDQRRMIDKVSIAGKEIDLILNKPDRDLLSKEMQAINDGQELKSKYGGIKNIPFDEMKKFGFERKLETPGYYILYKKIDGGGIVIIRGDYRSKKAEKEKRSPRIPTEKKPLTKENITIPKNIEKELEDNFSGKKQRDLIEKAQGGDSSAMKKLLKNNSGFIYSVAKPYISLIKENPLISVDDLMQQGNLGFIKAIKEFDFEKKTRLSTGAYYEVLTSIQRFIGNHTKTMRIPIHVQENIWKYKKARNKLRHKLSYEPTVDQISEAANLSDAQASLVEEMLGRKEFSLNQGIFGSDGDLLIKDIEHQEVSPDELIDRSMVQEKTSEYLKKYLTPKEYQVISLRYGLDGQNEHTQQEVGQLMDGISRQRIEQIEKKAKEKLKTEEKIIELRKSLDA